jgi:hypothetical protein
MLIDQSSTRQMSTVFSFSSSPREYVRRSRTIWRTPLRALLRLGERVADLGELGAEGLAVGRAQVLAEGREPLVDEADVRSRRRSAGC